MARCERAWHWRLNRNDNDNTQASSTGPLSHDYHIRHVRGRGHSRDRNLRSRVAPHRTDHYHGFVPSSFPLVWLCSLVAGQNIRPENSEKGLG